MTRLAALLLATVTAMPAFAQHDHDAMHHADGSPHAGHTALPSASAASHGEHGEHGEHGQSSMPSPHAQTHADHAGKSQAADPHAGHAMPPAGADGAQSAPSHTDHATTPPAPQPAVSADPHAGHVIPPPQPAHAGHGIDQPDPPVAPPPPGAFEGPAHAADTVFDSTEMAHARAIVRREHGAIVTGAVVVDRLEAGLGAGHDDYAWKAQAWHGGDIDRLWLKSEGEGGFGGRPERGEVQALWSHALDPWWNLQAGARQDFGTGLGRTHAALGIHGLAPYWFEVEGTVFLSDHGEVTARVELSYDQRLTRQLILQPEIELDLAARDMPTLGIGAGFSRAETGLRLRYQIVPEFAPYIGVRFERAIGDTADYRRARGDAASTTRFVIGLRAWF